MKRYVLDTNLYIDAARSVSKAEELAAFSAEFLPHIFLHAVVAQELLAGASTAAWRREIERGIVGPFERRGRIVTPTFDAWKRAGAMVAKLIESRRFTRGGVPRSFLNDALVAMSCHEGGMTLVTTNIKDFESIAQVEPVRYCAPWPKG
ncbi:MAG: type II toxin-antitoxin system VapC family toxin [Longimicrobiales bacterium]